MKTTKIVYDNSGRKLELCKCKKPVISYRAVNETVFTCRGVQDKKASTKIVLDPNHPTVFCDFRRVEKIVEPAIMAKIPGKSGPKFVYVPKTRSELIKQVLQKIRYFRSEKLFVTFQRLETACEKYGVKGYDHTNESVYEYTVRIENELTNMI